MDIIIDQIVTFITEIVKKKLKNSSVVLKPQQVKNHIIIFINCLIENPSFDSQTKEYLTTCPKDFGSNYNLSEKFLKNVQKSGITDSVIEWFKGKEKLILDKKCTNKKISRIKDIPKLEDANEAGTKNSSKCILILTEGDSAKSLAVAGLSITGRDYFGVYPLKGKCLNVREATNKQLVENAEINSLIKIIGLQYKRMYITKEDIKSLRYGKILIMTDQDQDGSHIKGLIINFIQYNWPHLIRINFIDEFITPIIKVKRGNECLSFYSIPEYKDWKSKTENWKMYSLKYYKGLGTSTSSEAKEYFKRMDRHRVPFIYIDKSDDDAIELAFSKKRIEDRKVWLTEWMTSEEKNVSLYSTKKESITYSEFINKELILFSNADNERSIPNIVDGLKPGQRKVLYTCFNRTDKEIKVAQLAGRVAEKSLYHHGEASLMSTIINLAQDYLGSNNINLLLPIGQFGTRLEGGKDSASPRYIFTKLNPLTRIIFPELDDCILKYIEEDNQKIEPEWYCPIIPMVLVNGASGIGTGWATKIPNYNPKDIIENIRRLIKNIEPYEMIPWYKNFKGTIIQKNDKIFITGIINRKSINTYEITELPVKVWTQYYKENVLNNLLDKGIISNYKELHTDTKIHFVVTSDCITNTEKTFKLESTMSLNSMVLFDSKHVLKKYSSVKDILIDFFIVRRDKYIQRKEYIQNILLAQADKLSNQARFILEKISGDIIIENVKKSDILNQLVERKYSPDPINNYTESNKFDYLINMKIIKLSEEEKEKLLKEKEKKIQELELMKTKTWQDLWNDDLNELESVLFS